MIFGCYSFLPNMIKVSSGHSKNRKALMPPALCPIHIQLSSCVILSRCLLEKTGKQRYKSGTDKGYTTACHKLLHSLGLCSG